MMDRNMQSCIVTDWRRNPENCVEFEILSGGALDRDGASGHRI
jgi:hypothetical protein